MPGIAAARPVVTVRMAVVPVAIDPRNPHSATYPGTGPLLGAPAALELEAKIGGTEYWGSSSPLTLVKVYAPAGVTVRTRGFPTCSEATLLTKGPEACPKGSLAGPVGEANGVVSLGDSRVHERVTLSGFFNPAGGLIFYDFGLTPASVEVIEKVTIASAASPFSKVWTAEVPLIETVPGAPYASVEQFKFEAGAAVKRGGKLISYATAPRTCPRGGAPFKVELSFLSGETVPVEQRLPCPKHRLG